MHPPRTLFTSTVGRGVALLMMLMLPLIGWGQTPLVLNAGTPVDVVQDFTDLTGTTWADNTTPITGWYARTDLTASITALGTNTGTSTGAGLYSFGTTADRAFGYAPSNTYTGNSGTGKGYLGWRLKNNTGSSITSFTVTYAGEQWRRESNASAHTLTFDYQTGTTVSSLVTGTYTAVPALTFTTPVTGTAAAAALNGNLAANRVAGITATITLATALPSGSEIMLRWVDLNDSGNDHLMAIDDVVVSFVTSNAPPSASLNAAPSPLSGFTYIVGNGPSLNQNFVLSGSNLAVNSAITITAPTDYEVSLTTVSTDFGPTATIANAAGGTLGNTNIYVRLKAGLGVNTYNNETVAVTGGGTATATNVTVNGSVMNVPTPTITLSAAALSAFTTVQGTASTPQTYTVSGTNLNGTDGITVTPPAGYEIGQGTTPTYSTSALTVAQTSAGTVGTTTISVRLAATTTVGGNPYTGDITHTSPNATTVNKAVTGTVTAPVPTVTVSTNSLAAFTTTTGTPSATRTYTVGGGNLTADIVVTAPAGYEVSLASTSGFGSSLTLTQTGGTVTNTPIYVRLSGAAAGSPSGNVTNVSGSASQNVAVTGTVTAPTVPALANYSLTTVNAGASSAPATFVATNVAATAITRGPGVSNVGSGAGLFGSNSWSAASLAAAQTSNEYLTFSITPDQGYEANVTSVTVNAYRTSSGPQTLELLVSTDDAFGSYTSLGNRSVAITTPSLLTFTPTTALPRVVSKLYFRLYGYTSGGGNMYLAQSGTTDGVVVYGTATAVTTPTIYTGTVSPMPACAGSNITVSYSTAGPAATGAFSVQLSDASGSFAAPVALTTVSSTATSVTATVAGSTANGTGYRVRVVNADGTIGTVSAAFAVQNASVSIAPTAPQNLNTGANGATLTATETPAAVSRQWFVSTTSGSGYTAIGGATGLTYVPNFTAPGVYYVVVQSVYSSCGTLTSNEVPFNVTTPTLTATPTSLAGFATTAGSASQAQTYALTGTALVSPVTVTAPAGFEVSLDGLTYNTSVVAAPVAINGTGQTVYVRLTGASLGVVNGNVTNVVGSTSASVAVSGSVIAAPGVLLLEDNFDYNGSLSANGWNGSSISTTIAGNITDTMYPKGVLALGGTSYQARLFGNTGNALYQTVTVPGDATTLYAAALVSVTAVQNNTSDYIFSFRTGSGTTNYRGRVIIARVPGSTPARYTYKLSAGSEAPTLEANPTEFSLNTDQLMVLKVENSDATNNFDKFSLYVLPLGSNLSQEPSTPLITLTSGNTFSTLNSFNIRQSDANNPNLNMDNFRMGTGWGAVVGNPVYAAAAATINAGSYHNVTVNNGSQATQAGAATVESQLALSGGKLGLNGQRLTLAGTVSGTGSLIGSATSNLTVLGTGALGTLNFATGGQTLSNFTLNRTGSGTAMLGTPLTVNSSLVLTSGALTTSTANLLTLATAATVAPTAAASGANVGYVNGPVARPVPAGTGTASFVFPVGKNSNYRPLTLNVTSQGSVATVYQAEQNEGDPGQTGTDPAATNSTTLTRVSSIRSFMLTPYDPVSPATVLQPTGFSGTVALSFDTNDRVNAPGDASLVIAKRSDSSLPWANINRSGNTASTVTSGTFNSFSDFALASTDPLTSNNPLANSNPLPVQLSSFDAQRQAASAVAVKWATATEKNAAYFDVQRSFNTHEFVTVATAKAQGNSSRATSYAILDKTAPAAALYYRLRQVDNDGTVTYSPMVSVAGSGEVAKVLLYPNPTSGTLHFIAGAATSYRVLNQLGQAVLHGTTEAGTASVDARTLPAGLYFLELQTATGRNVQKFEKQ